MFYDPTMTNCDTLEYRTLMNELADQVGRQHLPINGEARDINELLEGEAVHSELVRELVQSIYRRNRCNNLSGKVRIETVFNVLGEIRGRLGRQADTDIDQINFLEDLGWAVRNCFPDEDTLNASDTDQEPPQQGTVSQLPRRAV